MKNYDDLNEEEKKLLKEAQDLHEYCDGRACLECVFLYVKENKPYKTQPHCV
jgi:hypothetical protein